MSTEKAPIKTEDIIVLASEFFTSKDLEILNFSLTPYSNDTLGFLGSHKLLTIEVQEQNIPESRKVLKFFVKLPAKVKSEFFNDVFCRELKFFSQIEPMLMEKFLSDPWSPKCYLTKKNVIVLEDLRLRGFKSFKKVLNPSQMKSAITTLAQFHASSLLLENSLKEPLNEVFPEFTKTIFFSHEIEKRMKWLQNGCESIEAIAIKLKLNHKYVWPAYQILISSLKAKKGQLNVLGHHDLWFNNLMFSDKENDKCKIIDFQCICYIFYMIDLVQLIYLNNNKVTRRRMEKEFIEDYHSELVECLKKHGFEDLFCKSFDEIFFDYEDSKICGLVFAVQLLPLLLLNENFTEKYAKNVEKYSYESRKDFILDALKQDEYYKYRIEEIVEELIELMEKKS